MAIETELADNGLSRAHRKRLLACTALTGVATAGGWFLGLGFTGLATAAPIFAALHNSRLAAGAEGEQRVLGIPVGEPGSLATLPDTYTLFNNLRIPYEGHSVEIDLIAVGPNGVFIVEVKHYRGKLSGSSCGKLWEQEKRSTAGIPYTRTFRNPCGQVWRQILALRRWLGKGGYRGSIEGLVVCSHPEVELNVVGRKIPVLTLGRLAGWIEGFEPGFVQHQPHLPVPLLRELRSGKPLVTPRQQATPVEDMNRLRGERALEHATSLIRRDRRTGPRHVSAFMELALARQRRRRPRRLKRPRSTQDKTKPMTPEQRQ